MPTNNTNAGQDYDAIRCLGVPLPEKLTMMASWSADTYPDLKSLNDQLVERLTISGAVNGTIKKGDPLIPFLLPDSNGHIVDSQNLLSNGPLVVSFNRGHWCPFCLLELHALEEIHGAIQRSGGSIISITPQRASSAKKLKELCNLSFPVLCDVDNAYALSCGIMISIGDALVQAFKDFGIDLAVDQGNDGLFLPMPATYVINQSGIIAADYVQPDFRTRMPPQDILSALHNLEGSSD